MAAELRAGRPGAAAAALCPDDEERVWRLMPAACEELLRAASDAPPHSVPYVITWRHKVKRSSMKGARRWVLIALSHYPHDQHDGRFPSTDRLARDTGFTRRAVEKHLIAAEAAGWIMRRVRAGTGQGWRQMGYQLVLPADVANGVPQLEPWKPRQRGERNAPRQRKVAKTVRHDDAANVANGVPQLTNVANEIPNVAPKVANGVREGGEPRSPELLLKEEQKMPSEDKENLSTRVHEGVRARLTGRCDCGDVAVAGQGQCSSCLELSELFDNGNVVRSA